MPEISIEPLKSASNTVGQILEVIKQKPDISNDILRDSAIQRFEYTFDLAIKIIRRVLKATEENANLVENFVYKELIVKAVDREILNSTVETWLDYRKYRNRSSHSYDIETAEELLTIIPEFHEDVKKLIQGLEKALERK